MEDKTAFEELESKLSTTPKEISSRIGKEWSGFYKTYRRISNFNFYEILIYGTFIKKILEESNLTIEDIVDQVRLSAKIKG